VGRAVSLTCFLYLSSKGSSTGVINITGLPFTSGSPAPAVAIRPALGVTYTGMMVADVLGNDTVVRIYEYTEGGTITQLTNTNVANNSIFVLGVTYFV
jgi:hypothetical protein